MFIDVQIRLGCNIYKKKNTGVQLVFLRKTRVNDVFDGY